MKFVGIAENYKDLAGKWRVRVSFDDRSSTFLKFQKEPTEEEIIAESNKYISNLEIEATRLSTEVIQKVIAEEKIALVKDIDIAELRRKLGTKDVITK